MFRMIGKAVYKLVFNYCLIWGIGLFLHVLIQERIKIDFYQHSVVVGWIFLVCLIITGIEYWYRREV